MKTPLLILLSALPIPAPLIAGATAPCYRMDAAKSTLKFDANQMGAPFEGGFRKFQAEICFSAAGLATSHFDVTVDAASIDTQEDQRDTALRGADLFDVEHFKSAHFVTSSFRKAGATAFEATGKLTLRDVTRDVKIAFGFTTRKEGAATASYLAGKANLKRLDFGVGRGEYADTEAVGNDVQVKFNLRLLPAAQASNKKTIPTTPTPAQSY